MLFSEIIGQEDIKRKLINTVAENRVAHAQLFYGNAGHGKLALALAYAQFISCKDSEKFNRQDSCGTCSSCIKYNKLIHPDLHFIFPVAQKDSKKPPAVSNEFLPQWREMILENGYYISLNDWYQKLDIERKQASINVKDSGNIIHTLNYSSYESEYKVMLIWMVEKLHHQAAPRLLKILEEPPDKTVFLIIAEQTDMIISTILSRLHLVKIPKISDEALMEACKQKLGLDKEKAEQLVRLSNGSFKQAMIIQHQTETIEKDFGRFVEWMRMCYTPDVKAIMDFSTAQGKENRQQAMRFLQFGMEILRNCLMIHLGHTNLVRILDSQQNFYSKFAPFIHTENIGLFAEEFDKAIHDIDRNVNGGIIMLDLSLTVSRLLRMKEKLSA